MVRTRTMSARSERVGRLALPPFRRPVRRAQHKGKTNPRPKSLVDGKRLFISPVLDTLFYFMAERQRIFESRVSGEDEPWTTDPILQRYPFTNVFRVYDRTTQYVLRHVIREGSQDLHEACFRVILFRLFNKIETWKFLKQQIGELTWANFNVYTYEKVLAATDRVLYGHAYICPAPRLGGTSNAANHVRLIQLLMEENLPMRLKRFQYLKDAHGWLCLFPSMGEFTSLQLLLDLNMLPHFNFSEKDWVALGPGSKACLVKIFGPAVQKSELAVMRWLYETQREHFARLNLPVPQLHGNRLPGVTMVDLEHSLCECEKYSRAHHPHLKGKRTKVAKHIFKPNAKCPTADIPDSWRKGTPPPIQLTRPPPVRVVKGGPVWETSHIVAEERTTSNNVKYLLRWAGYGPEDDEWKQEDELNQSDQVLADWQMCKVRIAQKTTEFRSMDIKAFKVRERDVTRVAGELKG